MENSTFESDGHRASTGVGACGAPRKGSPPDSVLVVDDEEAICECIEQILGSIGHSVVTYTDPIEAVEYYRKNYINTALVILDVVMPAMNGRDVLLAMQAINPAIKAVMISGQCSEDVGTTCLSLGALEFVRKPFTLTEVIGVVDRHVVTSHSELC